MNEHYMTEMGGYRDRVAQVDLGDGAVDYRGIDEEDAEKYIGARGLGVKYVFDAARTTIDPLGPDNRLAFMTGPSRGPRP